MWGETAFSACLRSFWEVQMQLRLSRQRTLLRLTLVRSMGGSFLPGTFGVQSTGAGRLQKHKNSEQSLHAPCWAKLCA